jgi:predicted O-methyltransferase YrrM
MTTATATAPRDLVIRLMDGYLSTQMLYVAVRLGLPDRLIDGPRTSTDLAAAVGAAPAALHRLLRGLVMEGLLSEETDERFALTDAGRLLCADGRGRVSVRGAVLVRGALYYRAAAGLIDTIRGGGSAFRQAFGVDLFEHLATAPDDAAIFQLSMLARSHQEAEALATTYDFTPFQHVVDVGGGYGVTLAAILNACPGVRGTLFDRPDVADGARTRLAAAGLGERVNVAGGDFFEGVPGGGDVYVLSRVLHDWDDEKAVRILTSCRRAMPAGGRVVIVDAILGDRVHDQPAAVRMDLHMLTLASGRERTAAEFESLLRAANLRINRILTPAGASGIQIIDAVADDVRDQS